jgi:hypothetical protein
VSDEEHWANVIVVGRPYPPEDRNMTKLRQVLVDNRADPQTLGKIVNALRV